MREQSGSLPGETTQTSKKKEITQLDKIRQNVDHIKKTSKVSKEYGREFLFLFILTFTINADRSGIERNDNLSPKLPTSRTKMKNSFDSRTWDNRTWKRGPSCLRGTIWISLREKKMKHLTTLSASFANHLSPEWVAHTLSRQFIERKIS